MTPAAPDWPLPYWIAHRGAGKLAPENTLAAFREGAQHGYRAFECDAKLSADGVPFLLHDDTLQRTTPARGLAGARAWAELSRLDAGRWLDARWAGEPIPSLEAVVDWARAQGHALNVELKPMPGEEFATGEAIARACLQWWPTPRRLLFSSFKPEALRGARAGAPEIPRALLLDTLWQGWEAAARTLGCIAIVCHHPLLDGALRQRLRDAGWRALCYTVNDPAEVRRLGALGVDGLITDAVDRFAPDGAGPA